MSAPSWVRCGEVHSRAMQQPGRRPRSPVTGLLATSSGSGEWASWTAAGTQSEAARGRGRRRRGRVGQWRGGGWRIRGLAVTHGLASHDRTTWCAVTAECGGSEPSVNPRQFLACGLAAADGGYRAARGEIGGPGPLPLPRRRRLPWRPAQLRPQLPDLLLGVREPPGQVVALLLGGAHLALEPADRRGAVALVEANRAPQEARPVIAGAPAVDQVGTRPVAQVALRGGHWREGRTSAMPEGGTPRPACPPPAGLSRSSSSSPFTRRQRIPTAPSAGPAPARETQPSACASPHHPGRTSAGSRHTRW